ncbi:SDR family NAD(P)-dependent oxidoreductase [Algihabitans albus]|uniref:SDR family NAD(P)-dependent oxidoreductase n=1 Tax=Algihabitans albus TaxID=2164067 RepID=UPI000E5CAAE6|nr:SDR family NAD(P)-dependent oxidoreductase [Algihabitans albus]
MTGEHLPSYGDGLEVAVFGATGGLGTAFVQALGADPAVARVHALSRHVPVELPEKAVWHRCDLTDEDSVEAAAQSVKDGAGALQVVLVAVGLLQDEGLGVSPEKTWRQVDPQAMLEVYRINTVAPALAAKHFLPLLDRTRRATFAALSARVGSIEDNRFGGWHSYRASKAALNQLLRTFAIELARRCPTAFCIGLHPGTVDTGLSKPFQRNVPDGQLFSPAYSAGKLLAVLDALGEGDSGGLFAWDGTRIPY